MAHAALAKVDATAFDRWILAPGSPHMQGDEAEPVRGEKRHFDAPLKGAD